MRNRGESLVFWGLLVTGISGALLSAVSIPVGGIGWDAGIDTFAAQNTREISQGAGLAGAYDQVFSTSEFYGVLVQWAADSLSGLFGGATPLATDAAVTYQIQAGVSLALSVGAAVTAAWAVFTLLASRIAAAFVFATVTTLPLLAGMAVIDVKDTPVAAGLSALGAGSVLLWLKPHRKHFIAPSALIATGAFVALGVRISSWVLVGAVLGANVLAMVVWRVLAPGRVLPLRAVISTTIGLGIGLFGIWLMNPIARIDFPRWAWDAFLVSRAYPWIGEIRTMGQDLVSTDLPWWYVPTWSLAQMPVLFTAFAVAGIAVWIGMAFVEVVRTRSQDSEREYPRAIALVPFAVQGLVLPLGMVLVGVTLYDGIRHLLFAIPAIVVLMSPLAARLSRLAFYDRRRSRAVAWLAMLALVLVPLSGLIASIRWFPYMYAHVNVPTAAMDTDRNWEYDYWGTTVLEGSLELRKRGVEDVYVLPEIDPKGTAEVARISRRQDDPPDKPYGVYTFRRYDAAIPQANCDRVFTIERAGIVLGEGAICGSPSDSEG